MKDLSPKQESALAFMAVFDTWHSWASVNAHLKVTHGRAGWATLESLKKRALIETKGYSIWSASMWKWVHTGTVVRLTDEGRRHLGMAV